MRIFRQKLVHSLVQTCLKSGVVLGVLVGMTQQAIGQVTPRAGGAGTEVTVTDVDNATNVDITGGQRSSDGANLFHDFEQFNIDAGESAQFITTPDIQNVLSIITGGASTIDGLLQVLGSEADLYLINPAGILFGPNAQLNLPGSLSATTATGIGFGDEWLSVLDTSSQSVDYSRFLGRPLAFDFSGGGVESGSVISLGDLTLVQGHSLSLMGSTVINAGNLSVPGGKITLTAVSGNQLVRIGQGDRLLSLEVSPSLLNPHNGLSTIAPLAAPTLGQLLTGGSTQFVDTLVENADGTVSLVSTGTVIPEQGGTAVVLGQLSTDGDRGGEINVFGEQVALIDSVISAAGLQGGGTLRLGGDPQGSNLAPTARRTYVGPDVVLNADATGQGDGGQIYIWSDEATDFYGSLSAQGGYLGGDGGFGEISGKRSLFYDGTVNLGAAQGTVGTLLFDPDNITIKDGAGTDTPNGPGVVSLPFIQNNSSNGGTDFTLYEENLEAVGATASIILQATRSIIIEKLSDGVLSLQPGNSLIIQADINTNGTGGFSMDPLDTIRAPGGTVSISVGSNPGVDLIAGNIDTTAPLPAAPGNIILNARNYIQTGALNAGSGVIEITSNGIDFKGGVNSVVAQSILLQPDTPTTDVVIGGVGPTTNTLDLTSIDIAALADGIGLINIGRSNGTGNVTLSAATADGNPDAFNSPVRIQGTGITLMGPDLDNVWTVDFSATGDPVNTLSTYSNLSFYDVAGIVGGNRNDTIIFRDHRSRIANLIDGGMGDLTLIGNDFYLPTETKGEGNLFVRTLGPNVSIELGGDVDPGEPNTVNLLNSELTSLVNAPFESITIGSETGGNIILRDNFTFDSALTLLSGDRIDTTAGTLTTTGKSPLRLSSVGDIVSEHLVAVEGNISLVSSGGNVTATSIDARGPVQGNRRGGDISVTASDSVQVTGRINNDINEPSIATNEGNSIAITHGGNGSVPFTVGSPSSNGTVGAISNRAAAIAEGVFLGSYRDGALSISTSASELSAGLLRALQGVQSFDADRGGVSVLAPNLEEKTSQEIFSRIESAASVQFEQFLSAGGRELPHKVATLPNVQDTLAEAQRNLSLRPALVYVYFVSDAVDENTKQDTGEALNAFLQEGSPDDQLEVMLISSEGTPIRRRQWGITRGEVEAVAKTLRYEATSQFSRPADYLPAAQQLYRWIIQPLEAELGELQIDNLAFILDDGLRTIPLAVLHDGEQFLVEQYSLGLMPTFSLTDLTTSGEPLARSENEVLAMGASEFSAQPPLPAVEAELALISQDLWRGEAFLNEQFTLDNLKAELERNRYNILHLATHAVFNSGDWDNSYIQLWNERVTLSELNELDLRGSDIGLIILSACNTALGDRASEYGFAGFAVNAGSESALASLWPVSDEGTLGFMTQFYQQLSDGQLRSQSLQEAQISMLRGEVSIDNGQVKGPNGEVLAAIPELVESGNWDFSHPFYWSAFTMIGNPW